MKVRIKLYSPWMLYTNEKTFTIIVDTRFYSIGASGELVLDNCVYSKQRWLEISEVAPDTA